MRCRPQCLRLRCFLCLCSLLLCFLKLLSVRVSVSSSSSLASSSSPVSPFSPVSPSSVSPTHINCSAIFELEPVEVGRALQLRRVPLVEDDDSVSEDCSLLLRRGYTPSEAPLAVPAEVPAERFPLAFSLVVHKNAAMVERILRAVYAPENVYCIHYDLKSSASFISAMRRLERCLPNVFIASQLEAVHYAHVSRLRADLHCLWDLLRSAAPWRYVINLCGQDFPLKTNQELVSELRALNSSNMLESSRPSALKRQRFSFRHQLKPAPFEYHRLPVKTSTPKPPPPHGVQVFMGSAYFVLTRDFVQFVRDSPVAQDFLTWSEDTYSPDEHFWASLVRVPGAPGHIPLSAPDVSDLSSKTRLVKWNYLEQRLYPACTGAHQRSVCIYGAAELRWLLTYGHWFANKVDPTIDHVLIQCLEEKLLERAHQQRHHQRH